MPSPTGSGTFRCPPLSVQPRLSPHSFTSQCHGPVYHCPVPRRNSRRHLLLLRTEREAMNIATRTAIAIKTGTVTTPTGAKAKYDYTALWSLLLLASPELINGLVALFNYVLTDESGIHVPDNWKPWIRGAAFALAWFARSGLVRKPPEQDAAVPVPAPEPTSGEPDK